MKLIVLIGVIYFFALTGSAQWPGVEYSYARVGNYNLNSDLHGYHAPIKKGQLDSTVMHFAPIIEGKGLDSIIQIVTRKDQILLDGLSKCYIPHHAIIFYDSLHKPVAYISFCFMCQGIRTFPFIEERDEIEYDESLVEKAEFELNVIKQIISEWDYRDYYELCFSDTSSPGDMSKFELYGQQHSKSQEFKADLKDTLASYNYQEFIENNNIDVIDNMVSNTEISAGGQRFHFLDYADSLGNEIHFMSNEHIKNAGSCTYVLTDSTTLNVGIPIKVGMTIEEVNDIVIRFSGQDIFSGLLFFQSLNPIIYLRDTHQSYFEIKLEFEKSVLKRITKK